MTIATIFKKTGTGKVGEYHSSPLLGSTPHHPQTGLDIRNDPVIPKMHLITAMSQPRRQPATSLRARLVPARQPQAEHNRVGGGGHREADVVRDSSHAAVGGLHQLSFLALEKPGSVIFSTFPAQLISAGLHLSQQKYTHFQAWKLVRIQARLDNSWKTMRGKKGSLISSPWQSLCVWLRRRIKGRQSVIFIATEMISLLHSDKNAPVDKDLPSQWNGFISGR